MNYELYILKHGDIVQKEDYKIIAIDSKHDDRVEALIYIIEYNNRKILYGTDLLEISPKVWELLNNVYLDVVFLDQTYGNGINNGGHLNANQVINIVRKMRERNIINDRTQVYATHLSHEGNFTHDIIEKEAIKSNYRIAYDGLNINI